MATASGRKRNIAEECNPGDLKALTGFKNGIHIDTSGRLAKWVGRSCCRWEGVSCNNATGRVTEIRLPGFISTNDFIFQSQMEGRLSPSITLLTSLEVLDLGELIGLTGRIPPSIGHLQNLKELYLYKNKLRGPVPESIGCGIEGQIPDFLQSTPSPIQELDLSVNHLNGAIPSWIGSLTQLYSLNLSRNHFVSGIPDSVADLQELGVLDLHSNKISGSMNQVFKIGNSFPDGSLTYVDLSDNSFTSGTEQIGVGAQQRIQYLNLSHNLLEGQLPTSIGKLKALQSLDLSCNKFGFSLAEAIANLSLLETLKLQRNHFTGKIPVKFLNLKNLKDLDLSDNLLEGEIPAGKPLSDFPQSSFTGNRGLCGKPLSPCMS
ncbi:hypothetical protein COLO4_36236 [Corchorus olitorius]|uniref:Leucine-rich repeat-containing N-terminal plant-type domain-containing protein n=1 Tax=Corchorus olitorius TaxID=93759 RepID=A0A1R3GAA1_9ROSI|nr:hypothetical protein COLO4_36236 [Corchorus olitorius]